MTREQISNEYYNWICGIICDTNAKRKKYSRLLAYLYSKDFNYIIGRDGNRAEDGMDLRYRFGYEKGIDSHVIAAMLDNDPCSVLEMMVALSLRCEENIMHNVDEGDRTGFWFWNMVKSLGLYSMTNDDFDIGIADEIMERFIDRRYSQNGEGGLFTIPNMKRDMRSAEIWYQMMWYLDYILEL